MKQQSLVKNYVYNLSYQLLLLIVPLVTMPYVSRVLGQTNIGIFNYIQSVVSYFVLFGCIGLNLYGQREIAFCRDNIEARSRVFFELLSIRVITITVSLAMYIGGVVMLAEHPVYYFLYGIEIAASLFDISWFFQGIEFFRIQTIRNFLVKITGVACIFMFVKSENDLWVYIICYTATVFIGNAAMWICLRGNLKWVCPSFSGVCKHIFPALMMFLPQIATSVYAQLDKTMLKHLSDYDQVAFYSQAEKIVKLVLTVVTAMGIVMLSRIAKSYSGSDTESVKKYITKSFRFLFLLAWPCTFGLMAVADDFAPWFFGEGYDGVGPCMMVLSPIIILIGISNVIGTQYLLPTKQMKLYTVSVLTGMVVNATLNVILIRYYYLLDGMGCIGAAIATVCAELSVTVVQMFCVRKIFPPKVLLYGVKNFIAAAVMAACVCLVSRLLSGTAVTQQYLVTILEVIVGGVVYAGMLLLMRDKFFIQMINRVLHRKSG